jgi:hypothetical protein
MEEKEKQNSERKVEGLPCDPPEELLPSCKDDPLKEEIPEPTRRKILSEGLKIVGIAFTLTLLPKKSYSPPCRPSTRPCRPDICRPNR